MNLIDLIPNFFEMWLVIIIGIVVYVLTFITTHSYNYNLMQIEMFAHKPFTCWLCSFCNLNIFISINLTFINPMFLVWGGIVTLIGGYWIYHRNKEREKEYRR